MRKPSRTVEADLTCETAPASPPFGFNV